jgi:hypothetical protein
MSPQQLDELERPAAAATEAEQTRRLSAHELLAKGGEWLGAARNWLQWHAHNGESVTWGSNDDLRPTFTVAMVEDLAATVAAAAMAPQPDERFRAMTLKARWKAEMEAERLRTALRALVDACTAGHVDGWQALADARRVLGDAGEG